MAINKINDFTITDFFDFEAYDRVTGALDFRLEDMQNFTLNATEEKTELTGKNGRVIGVKKTGKKLTGEGTYGVVSAGLMKAQTGGEIINGVHIVKKSELKTVSGTTVVTDAKAIGTVGAEIGTIRVIAANGAVSGTYEQASVADATHFSYDTKTKTITLPTDAIEDGTKIEYAYEREVNGTKVTDPSDKFSETREVWIHIFGIDACDNKYYAAIYIPRADFSGEFSLELGGDQTVHNFSFDAITDLCKKSVGSNLFELIIYTDEVV